MPKLIRVTTVPMALKVLLPGQMKYMKEEGFDVIMVSADGREREDVIRNEGVPHRIIHMTRKITPFTDLKSLRELYRFFKKEKPDIVHSHTPKAGLLAMWAAKMAGVPIRIHTVAGLRFMTSKGFTRKVLIQMEKLTGRWATHIWPNSYSLLQYLKTNQLIPASRMEVIGHGSSNGINLNRYSIGALDPLKLAEIKKRIKYEDNLRYLLCVGRIVKDKGIDELLHAFVRIYKENEDIRLILVGEFEDALDPVSESAREILKSHPGIILAGWSDEVEYFMHLSTILVHPSHREGFPNVLLQAGAMYCPIVCSRIEGNIDVVEHEKTGLIFEVGNSEELFHWLNYALSHPEVLKQFSGELRKRIELHFDMKVVHKTLATRYKELIRQ